MLVLGLKVIPLDIRSGSKLLAVPVPADSAVSVDFVVSVSYGPSLAYKLKRSEFFASRSSTAWLFGCWPVKSSNLKIAGQIFAKMWGHKPV